MADDPVYLERDGATRWLVLDRPEKRNALSLSMWQAIPALVAEAEADPGCRVLAVRGAGDEAFAAGADISEFPRVFATAAGRERYSDAVGEAEQCLGAFPRPTVAVIRGDCIGGGVELALACDMRFAAGGSRFGITPARLGVVYSLASTRRLMHLVGVSRTRDLLYTGRLFDAREALEMGLVDALHPAAALDDAVAGWIAVVNGNSGYSVAAAKAITGMILDGATNETPESRALRVEGFAGDDAKEGIAAWLEKRKPGFPDG